MFVWTFRKGGIKKLGVVCACGVLLVAAAVGVNALRFRADEDAQPAAAGMTQEIAGAQDIVTYFKGQGVETDVSTATVTTVTVPRKWDESFKAFHAVIEESGLTLKKCKGKQVDKWTVLVPAQSTEESKTYAVALVYKNEPVGAYLLQKPSGEVLPLTSAAAAAAPLTDEEIAANAAFGTSSSVPPDAEDTAADVEAALDEAAATAAAEGAMPTE